MLTRPVVALFAVTALLISSVHVSHAEEERIPDLARRCEAAAASESTRPIGLSSADPPKLLSITAELRERGVHAVDDILSSLPHSDALRRVAPGLLAAHPSDRTRSALLQLLADPNDAVANRAADALGDVGGVEVISPLVAIVAGNRRDVRHNALNALHQLGAADRAVDSAIDAVRFAPAGTRMSAAQLLAELQGSKHVERALDALDRQADLEQRRDVLRVIEWSRAVLRARLGR